MTISHFSRRDCLRSGFAAAAAFALPSAAAAQSAAQPFEQWVETFRARAKARGISEATYNRVMVGMKPDMGVFALQRSQPEFSEQLWQYLNRRVSEWRITYGKERAKEFAPLLAKI